MKTAFGFWECDFCEKRYTKEAAYNKHKCDMMERAEFLGTQRGRFCLQAYNTMMKVKGNQKQSIDVFRESKLYSAVVKFVEFYYSNAIPDMEDYIDFCVNELDLLPAFWTRNDVYELYINAFDERLTPDRQADITLKHIAGLAGRVGCEIDEVFEYMEVQDITKFIQCRRWSPWVLLASSAYAQHVVQCNEHERIVLEAMINRDIWAERFRKWPKARKRIQILTKEFGI